MCLRNVQLLPLVQVPCPTTKAPQAYATEAAHFKSPQSCLLTKLPGSQETSILAKQEPALRLNPKIHTFAPFLMATIPPPPPPSHTHHLKTSLF